jgi:hypothetical protein
METENNFDPEFLSDSHREYILAYLERAQAAEQAAIDDFLKEK